MSDVYDNWYKIGEHIGNIGKTVDEINTRLKAKDNEAYNKGLKDMRESMIYLYEHSEALYTLFKTGMMYYVLDEYDPQEIIEKVNQWKAEKDKEEQELHIGDEIMVINYDGESNNRTFVIYEIDDYHYYVIEPITFYKDGFYKSAYEKNQLKKTGKHYDSIPLSKEIK